MSRRPLDVTATVKLDGSGKGTAQLGPQVVREFWQPSQASINVSTQTNEASCILYLGTTIISAQILQETLTGSTGDVYGFNGNFINPGQQLFAVWTGGDANATATLRVIGFKDRYGV